MGIVKDTDIVNEEESIEYKWIQTSRESDSLRMSNHTGEKNEKGEKRKERREKRKRRKEKK